MNVSTKVSILRLLRIQEAQSSDSQNSPLMKQISVHLYLMNNISQCLILSNNFLHFFEQTVYKYKYSFM